MQKAVDKADESVHNNYFGASIEPMLNIIATYIIVNSKHNEIPAKIYFAKHLSLITLFTSQMNHHLCHSLSRKS